MYERFTERAREVVVLAQDAARGLGNNEIRPEHLLIGLLGERDSAAAWTLGSLGVDLVSVVGEVTRIEGQGPDEKRGQIPFTAAASQVIELATAESERDASGFVGPDHILLGLLDQLDAGQGEGVVPRVLAALGVSSATVREALAR